MNDVGAEHYILFIVAGTTYALPSRRLPGRPPRASVFSARARPPRLT